ncbi:glycosyltransferase family 2 protein [Magnetospirillum sp. SS-4]|uniref:glycosyltransferase family 2 protein n=1 Tax=Magnetospirillum sp. SS-4 TaxID=2681465 RepID=UPI001384B1BD|nr:glycosyltransferase family 2 protein [Magnetospirillum sp. SS-4]CAA7623407.1 Glycosyl transferase family 2 [Magnetospirillum sp. SS-4]
MKIAVLIPCYNEEHSIEQVVRDFRAALPEAAIHVYDNNSRDRTVDLARAAGAIVRSEPQQGKGNVVRRMFSDIEADVYVMVDGDATYHAPSAPRMVARLVDESLDMVVGTRLHSEEEGAFRAGHQLGNRMLTGFVAWLFGDRFQDMLSGYRVFSRRFVKSFPAMSKGFETETELVVHALSLSMPVAEIETPYFARPEGSVSKLNTYRDGWRILMTILALLKRERPLALFGAIFALLALLALILAEPVVATYLQTGQVPRLPTALLATGIMILAFLSLTAGVVLDTVTHGRREIKRLHYLGHRAPGAP